MDKNIFQALFVIVVNSKMTSGNGLSLIFWLHPLHVMDNDLFHKSFAWGTDNTGKEDTSRTMPFKEYPFSDWKESWPQLITAVVLLP